MGFSPRVRDRLSKMEVVRKRRYKRRPPIVEDRPEQHDGARELGPVRLPARVVERANRQTLGAASWLGRP